MADKKKPAEHSSSGPWLGIGLEIIFVIALVLVFVYGADKPFTPTFLNLDYVFGKMLAFFTFFANYHTAVGLKIFIGFVVVFLIGLDFYLLLRILEMEEEHRDHAYHHAIDEVHGGAKPRSLLQEFTSDMSELADDATILAKRTVEVGTAGAMNTFLYKDEADVMDKNHSSQPPASQNISHASDKEGSSKWRVILKHINSNNPSDWKLAIIEADTILDTLVERSGFPGDTLGERLKNADRGVFRTLNFAGEAHGVRNRIAHDGSNFVLTDRDAKMTVKKYEEVFREFDYI